MPLQHEHLSIFFCSCRCFWLAPLLEFRFLTVSCCTVFVGAGRSTVAAWRSVTSRLRPIANSCSSLMSASCSAVCRNWEYDVPFMICEKVLCRCLQTRKSQQGFLSVRGMGRAILLGFVFFGEKHGAHTQHSFWVQNGPSGMPRPFHNPPHVGQSQKRVVHSFSCVVKQHDALASDVWDVCGQQEVVKAGCHLRHLCANNVGSECGP